MSLSKYIFFNISKIGTNGLKSTSSKGVFPSNIKLANVIFDTVPDGALSRRVSWESRREINIGKLLVALDVFSESGLISYHFKEGMINVCLKPYEGKADISGSVVLRTLQSMAG